MAHSINPSDYLKQLAEQIQEEPDLSLQEAIFLQAKEETDTFTKIPEGCDRALEIIQTLGLEAKTLLDQTRNDSSKMEADPSIERSALLSTDSKYRIKDENNLTKKTIEFLSKNSKEIKIAGATLAGLCTTAAIFHRYIYPISIGLIGGSLVLFFIKTLIDRPVNSDEDASSSTVKDEAKVKKTPLQINYLYDHDNLESDAIATHALVTFLLNPLARKVDFSKKGVKLYSDTQKILQLKKEAQIHIEDIIKADLLDPQIFLDPKILKPNNDLKILREENDLKELIEKFINLANKEPIGAIINRPPLTFAIFYNPSNRQFIFLDTKKKDFEIFRSIDDLVKTLMKLSPIVEDKTNLNEFYKTPSGIFQNPNACEIKILRKKQENSKEEIDLHHEDGKAEEIDDRKEDKSSSAFLTEDERLQESERKALEAALRLSEEDQQPFHRRPYKGLE